MTTKEIDDRLEKALPAVMLLAVIATAISGAYASVVMWHKHVDGWSDERSVDPALMFDGDVWISVFVGGVVGLAYAGFFALRIYRKLPTADEPIGGETPVWIAVPWALTWGAFAIVWFTGLAFCGALLGAIVFQSLFGNIGAWKCESFWFVFTGGGWIGALVFAIPAIAFAWRNTFGIVDDVTATMFGKKGVQ